MTTSILWLPDFTPTSANELLGHWTRANKLKRLDRDLVAYYARQQRLAPATTPRRVSLRIVLRKGQRAIDRSNAWKSLEDALVHAGLLVNDSPRWCTPGPVEFVRSAGELRETFVVLEDIE